MKQKEVIKEKDYDKEIDIEFKEDKSQKEREATEQDKNEFDELNNEPLKP